VIAVANVVAAVEQVKLISGFAGDFAKKMSLVLTRREQLAVAGLNMGNVHRWVPGAEPAMPNSALFVGSCVALNCMKNLGIERTVDVLIVSNWWILI
jgi:hypothetical protein